MVALGLLRNHGYDAAQTCAFEEFRWFLDGEKPLSEWNELLATPGEEIARIPLTSSIAGRVDEGKKKGNDGLYCCFLIL